jgi:hypothetical protein
MVKSTVSNHAQAITLLLCAMAPARGSVSASASSHEEYVSQNEEKGKHEQNRMNIFYFPGHKFEQGIEDKSDRNTLGD